MGAKPDLSERVTELEIQLTHAQRAYDELNQVVIEQAKELQQFRQRVHKLQEEIEGIKQQPSTVRTLEDEKPPHY